MRNQDKDTHKENKTGRFGGYSRRSIEKATSVCIAAFLIVSGGYLGINRFMPDERIINLNEYSDAAVTMKADESRSVSDEYGESFGDMHANELSVNAKSALLMDAGTGTVLYAYNAGEKRPPASVTKIMTMLLVLEAVDSGKISLDDTVTVSANAAGMGGSQMYMEEGEQHTLEEILKGVAMVSANDGCVAAAEHLCGSTDIFVESMNKRAAELGMENTHFVNTNGLPAENHYSSAYDIALMSRELMNHMDGREWFTTWQDTITVGLPGKEKEFGLTNTNKLIKQYKGAIGIKTGFTSDAGYCLSGAAERDGTTLIAVVMGCETSNIRLKEISTLLDYGFANYETVRIAKKGDALCEIDIEKGNHEKIDGIAAEDIAVLVKKGESEKITFDIAAYDSIDVPLKKGEDVGEVTVYKEGSEIKRYKITASNDIKKANVFEIYKRLMEAAIKK